MKIFKYCDLKEDCFSYMYTTYYDFFITNNIDSKGYEVANFGLPKDLASESGLAIKKDKNLNAKFQSWLKSWQILNIRSHYSGDTIYHLGKYVDGEFKSILIGVSGIKSFYTTKINFTKIWRRIFY